MMQPKKAIIIGSGVAGIATAIRLAVQGFAVSVYEAKSYPGGKLSHFSKDGFHFDAGPSLFTQPQNIVDLFTLAKEPIDAYFTYQKINIACKYFFENGVQVNAYSNADLFAKELMEKVNEPQQNLKNYLANSKKLYNNIANIFLNFSLHKKSTWLRRHSLMALGSLLQQQVRTIRLRGISFCP